jgi:PAS domain S-box-containing protein
MDIGINSDERAAEVPDLLHLCHTIFDSSPLPIAVVEGEKHTLRYVNPAFCHLDGTSKEQLIGKRFGEIWLGDGYLSSLDRVYRTGEAETHAEPERSEPQTAYWSYAMWPVKDADEHTTGVVIQVTETAVFRQQSTAMNQELLLSGLRQHELIEVAERLNAQLQREITERRLAEEALFKAGALQRAIFNSANFSSIATDANGIIQIFNVGAERMLGYTAAEVMNKITPADISDSREVIARAKALSHELRTPIKPGFEALVFKASRGIEDIYALTYVCKDGSRIPAMVSVTALRDAQDAIIGYLLIGTDNTARQRMEQALLNSEKLAATARLASTMSHEINNPLGAITNLIFLLAPLQNSPEAQAYVATLEEQVKGLSRIATQMLKFHRDNNRPTEFKLDELLREISDFYRPQAERQGIVVIQRFETEGIILGFRGEIIQVVTNLLLNALEATPVGGKVIVHLYPAPPWLCEVHNRCGYCLSIADTGVGIAPEHYNQIFEPFFTTKGEKGTGLGLWLCTGIVNRVGGSIRVWSSHRLGRVRTCFSVFLPAEEGSFTPLRRRYERGDSTCQK